MAHVHHHDHSHANPEAAGNSRRLLWAFGLISSFMLVEAIGGWLANSLTLLADAGHMAMDAFALGLAAWAASLAGRERNPHMTYGYQRVQVLVAALNALLLLALVVWIVVEAIGRLRAPQLMLPVPALIIASIGFVVNLIAFRWLHGSHDMNSRAAALHVLGDLLGSVAAITAALATWLWGWVYADPILAFVIGGILMRGAIAVLLEAGRILLEGVPPGVDIEAIKAQLATIDGVTDIHHVHAWSLTAEQPLLTAHAVLDADANPQQVLDKLKHVLESDFGIEHSTIQIEPGSCPDETASADDC